MSRTPGTKRAAHTAERPLTMYAGFHLTTLTGRQADWTVVVSPARGDLHEVMKRVAPGFAPRPEIAAFLRGHEADWEAGPNARVSEQFMAGDFACMLDGDDFGWTLVWQPNAAPGKLTSQPHVTRSLRLSLIEGDTAPVGEVAAIVGAKPPILVGEDEGYLRSMAPWTFQLEWDRTDS